MIVAQQQLPCGTFLPGSSCHVCLCPSKQCNLFQSPSSNLRPAIALGIPKMSYFAARQEWSFHTDPRWLHAIINHCPEITNGTGERPKRAVLILCRPYKAHHIPNKSKIKLCTINTQLNNVIINSHRQPEDQQAAHTSAATRIYLVI